MLHLLNVESASSSATTMDELARVIQPVDAVVIIGAAPEKIPNLIEQLKSIAPKCEWFVLAASPSEKSAKNTLKTINSDYLLLLCSQHTSICTWF